MGEARPGLTDRTLLLLIADATGGTIDGRTIAQKLAYFVGRNLNRSFEHHAHFFGPFSSKVESSLKLNVLSGELKESVETMPSWYGGPDVLKYSYALTDEGRARVQQLRAELPDEAAKVGETVAA